MENQPQSSAKSSFIADSIETLISPKTYFPKLKEQGNYGQSVIKVLIYGVIAGILSYIHIGFLAKYSTQWIASATLITTPVLSVIGLFAGAVILLIISAICGGNTKYEINVRITAALFVLVPIQTLLGYSSLISIKLSALLQAGVSLYGLYLMYLAIVHTLAGKAVRAKVIAVIIGILVVIGAIASIFAVSKMKRIMKNPQFQEMIEQATENMSDEERQQFEEYMENMDELQKMAD
jgi:hypothetical protein